LYGLPNLISFLLVSVLFSYFALIVLRIVFWAVFKDPHDRIPNLVLLKSFYIGLKFDLRLVLLVHLPILLLGWIKPLQISDASFGGALWCGYLVAAAVVVLLFYFFDFGHYGYLEDRLDATVLRFLYNPKTSFQMIWESYPVLKGIALFVLLVVIYWVCLKWLMATIPHNNSLQLSMWKKAITVGTGLLIYALGIYGNLTHYPLRWCDAFFSTNTFANALALNPVLYFFDTLKYRDVKYDSAEVRKYYDRVATYLGVPAPDRQQINFIRPYDKTVAGPERLNVVIVFLESFAYYKTSMSGNPLDPTPHVQTMANNSLMFPRFFVPHSGTARSIFTAITGLPDVELIKTSSRNPLVVRQHSIVNAFEGYEKFFFLGGSANWGEIRGMLSHNIPGLQIYEEGSYTSPRVDGWGISDLHLFEEADRVLREKKDAPFFAIIQTSGNHRPFTIPEDNRGFQLNSPSEEDAIKYGFESAKAVNSIRFLDHSVKFFLDAARESGYLDNTMFVFLGDHGSAGRHPTHMPRAEDELKLTRYRVPLIIHAPGLIKQGQIHDKVASEMDLLPTLAALLSVPHVNSTLGRDFFDDQFDRQRFALIVQHQRIPDIGLIGDKFYFLVRADGSNVRLYHYFSDTPERNVIEDYPEIVAQLEPLCRGLYETAKYMRFNNSPEMIASKIEITPLASAHPEMKISNDGH